MELIERIEQYRRAKGHSKADMARLFDVPLQNYNNWCYRGSLPKGHIERAQQLLMTEREKRLRQIVEELESVNDHDLMRFLEIVRVLRAKQDVRGS